MTMLQHQFIYSLHFFVSLSLCDFEWTRQKHLSIWFELNGKRKAKQKKNNTHEMHINF
jgi:hypothetical protein